MAIERHFSCWKDECAKKPKDSPDCNKDYLDCSSLSKRRREQWAESTVVFKKCDASDDEISFQFGMFGDASSQQVTSAGIVDRYFYCLWWGLKSLWYSLGDLALNLFSISYAEDSPHINLKTLYLMGFVCTSIIAYQVVERYLAKNWG